MRSGQASMEPGLGGPGDRSSNPWRLTRGFRGGCERFGRERSEWDASPVVKEPEALVPHGLREVPGAGAAPDLSLSRYGSGGWGGPRLPRES